MRNPFPRYWLLIILLATLSANSIQPPVPVAAAQRLQPSLSAFKARLPVARKQIPVLSRSADAAAARIMVHPSALINVPYASQAGFSEELIARAGGLSNAFPTEVRPTEATPHDVVLFSVRSWEKDGAKAVELLKEFRDKGWLTILFGSQTGRPQEISPDFFVDNGATSPGEDQAATNAIVNSLNSWMWCCEYLAAMTRRGKCPGVLKSISYDDADAINVPLQKRPGGAQWLGEGSTPVPAGKLAAIYLRRIEHLYRNLRSRQTQKQIHYAASLIAKRMAAGRKVAVSGTGHLFPFEMRLNTRAPWQPFNAIFLAKTAFKENLKEGDLLYWVGYLGVNSKYEDYAGAIRETKTDVIVSVAPDKDPANNGPWALAHLDQSWTLGDAEVSIPCPPGRMAPISGINATILFRMLDDEVATRLAALKPPGSR